MKLRNRAVTAAEQHSSKQPKQPATIADVDHTEGLPAELLQLLGNNYLIAEDVAAASLVCKHWAQVFRAGITNVTLVVNGPDGPWPEKTLEGLGTHTSVADLELLINSRSGYTEVVKTLDSLHLLPKLKHLNLRFIVSRTPKKGSWPAYFAGSLDVHQLESLTVQSTNMPDYALLHLLTRLQAKPRDGSPSKLRHLDLIIDQKVPGSQLPAFTAPSWLVDAAAAPATGLSGHQLDCLAAVPSLATLRCPIKGSVLPHKFAGLSKLTGLTELVCYGKPLFEGLVQALPLFRSLRRLSFTLTSAGPAVLEGLDLSFVQELDLGLMCDARGKALAKLLSHPPPAMKGLMVDGLVLGQATVDDLAAQSQLTSLYIYHATAATPFLDLTPLRQLSGLQQLSLQVSKPLEVMQVRFTPPPPPPKPERVLTGACQSVGKRRKSAAQRQQLIHLQLQQTAQESAAWGDASAMLTAWPHLQSLKLCGLPPYAVALTQWHGLSTLTALTRLVLQFQPASSMMQVMCSGCAGLKQPTSSPGGGLPVVRLEHLPAGVQELQLASCYVGVPAEGCLRAGDALRSVSLSKCYMGAVVKGRSDGRGRPIIIQYPAEEGGPTPQAAGHGTQPVSAQHPLLMLLQHTQRLRMLELIDLPWLSDAVLSAAAAQTHLQRQLETLSVVGIGNQLLTHGSLLGLTGLRKLRELRWHVGSVLELMPDVQALAQLQGLMRVHLPHWLHQQMERWGAYAVLDSMPLCDVDVELA